MGVQYPNEDITAWRTVHQDHLKGYEFKYQSLEGTEKYHYRFRILIGKKIGYLVSVILWNGNPDIDRLYDQVTRAIRFDQTELSADRLAELNNQEAQNQAIHYNRIGIFFYKAKQYNPAVDYFREAIHLAPTDSQYITNCMSAYNQLGRYQEALALLEKHLPDHKDNQDLSSWHAWMLKNTNRPEAALEVYRAMFSNDYRNDEDFTAYVGLLANTKSSQELQSAFSAYRKKHGTSLDLILEQAKLLARLGNHKTAIHVLVDYQTGIPFNAQIAFALIRNHTVIDQPKQSLETAKALIKNGYASADAYYLMGKAELKLKWYRRAKESFENALQLDPADEDIQHYVRHISALLGEGDNTTIKDEISPVRLPTAITEKLIPVTEKIKIDGYNSLYLNRIKSIAFDPGKELKNTTFLRIKVLDAAGVSRFSSI